jgi:hypothetical protein
MILLLFGLLIAFIIVFLLFTGYGTRLFMVGDIVYRSRDKTSFVHWAAMIREYPGLTCVDYSPSTVEIPSEPHFVLTNHIASHCRIGTHIGMALVAPTCGCRIVCFRDYNQVLNRFYTFFFADTMNQILRDEIVIEKNGLDNQQKEQLLVKLIHETFARGENVLWFVDAGVGSNKNPVMRTLVRKVLGHFPEMEKQLVHIREPSDSHTFGFRRYTATKDLDFIVQLRTQIVAGYTH